MKKFEYDWTYSHAGKTAFAVKLSEMGKQGWEVVQIDTSTDGFSTMYVGWLKREIPAEKN